MTYLRLFDPGRLDGPVDLGARDEGERRRLGDRATESVYVYTDEIILAVNVALATDRPLLVRGVSGSGKSSLARDVAEKLGWRYRSAVVTSRTQARDLLWTFDAVRRLSEASSGLPLREPRAFVRPGVLWWAFDAGGARRQEAEATARPEAIDAEEALGEPVASAGPDARVDAAPPGPDARVDAAPPRPGGEDDDRPAIILIDEIDKADPDVPNDLLVPFGSLTFVVDETGETVTAPAARRPLLVLTTNEERDLPPAFLRRCVTIRLPGPTRDRLISIGRAHFPDADDARLGAIAEQFVPEAPVDGEAVSIASTAEYLDAIQASLDLRISPDPTDAAWAQIVQAIVGSHDPSPDAPPR